MRLPSLALGSCLLATTVALTTVLPSAPAAAEPTWLTPGDISTRSALQPEDPAVDVNAAGVAAAVWVEPAAPNIDVVRLAHGIGGGGFAPSQVISGNEALANTSGDEPQVAVAADGSGVVAWFYRNGVQYSVRYRTFGSNGALGPIVDETLPAAVTLSYLALDVNGAGRFGLAWIAENRPYGAVGTLSAGLPPATPLESTADGAYRTQVGLDAAGDAVFAWERDFLAGAGHYQVEARIQPAGGVLSPVTVLEGSGDDQRAENPSLSVAADGRAVVAYGYRPTGLGTEATHASVRNVAGGFAGGTWSPPMNVASPGQVTYSGSTRAAMLPDGGAVVVYEDFNTNYMWAASRPSGGAFGGQQALDNVNGEVAAVGVGAGGAVVTVIPNDTTANGTLMAAARPAGASQFAGTNLAVDTMVVGSITDASVAVDDQGNAHAVYFAARCVVPTSPCPGGNYTYAIRSVVLDAGPPVVSEAGIPQFAVVKRKTAFSTVAADRLSTTTVGWSFGDQATAAGASVLHTYKKQGTFPVTMTAADGHNNVTTRTGNVKVLAAALPSRLKGRFKAGKKSTTVTNLSLKKLVAGSKVVLTCKGKGCPVKSKSFKIEKLGGLSLTSLFARPPAHLAPGVTLLVKVTAKKATGVFFGFTMVAGKAPLKSSGCLAPNGQQFDC